LVAEQTSLVTFLWEFNDAEMQFGCLNPTCADKMPEGLSANSLVLLGWLIKLTISTVLAIGLAIHCNPSKQYKSRKEEVASFLSMLIIIGTTHYFGMQDLPSLKTSAVNFGDDFLPIVLPLNIAQNDSKWYPFSTDFRLTETCAESPCG